MHNKKNNYKNHNFISTFNSIYIQKQIIGYRLFVHHAPVTSASLYGIHNNDFSFILFKYFCISMFFSVFYSIPNIEQPLLPIFETVC